VGNNGETSLWKGEAIFNKTTAFQGRSENMGFIEPQDHLRFVFFNDKQNF